MNDPYTLMWTSSFSGSINCNDFNKVFNSNKEVSSPFTVEGVVKRIPKRRHKKRRIAKKWAKRYGYYVLKIHGTVESLESMSDKDTFNYNMTNVYYTIETSM